MATPFVRAVNVSYQANVNTNMQIFKLTILLCALLIVQTPNKPPIDLSFEQKLPGWLKETNVPAAGIGIIFGAPQIVAWARGVFGV